MSIPLPANAQCNRMPDSPAPRELATCDRMWSHSGKRIPLPGPRTMPTIDYSLHTFRSPHFQRELDKAIIFFEITPTYKLPSPNTTTPGPNEPPPFTGPGAYALYYRGDCAIYAPLTRLNQFACSHPIYVGTAVPPGWRKGRAASATAKTLYNRLRQHAASIYATGARALKVEDFWCRFMILNDPESKMITVVEAELISKYQPLWNSVLDGFGNHPVGGRRVTQKAAPWDVVHPGRPARATAGLTQQLDDLLERIRAAQDLLRSP
jgi:hypothetical protein